MRRILAAAITATALVFVPCAAAKPPTRAHVREYRAAYHAVAHRYGARTPGRNIVRDGMVHRRTNDADVVRSIVVLRRMLAPSPRFSNSRPFLLSPGSASQGSFSSTTVAGGCGGSTPYAGGGQCWAIPWSIVLCESHGQNVPNSSGSGANGYYQLMSGGTGSRSEQDQAAAALWNGGRGAGNWVCK